jgi:hypothetical protein
MPSDSGPARRLPSARRSLDTHGSKSEREPRAVLPPVPCAAPVVPYRSDAEHPTQRLARSGIRSAAVISGIPLAGPWRGAGPAGPPDPRPAVEGSYAGWLGAQTRRSEAWSAGGVTVPIGLVIPSPSARVDGQPVNTRTAGSGKLGVGWTRESRIGVNPWPLTHQVFTCSTGPLVDSHTQRSTMSAEAPQPGCGQETMCSIGGSSSCLRDGLPSISGGPRGGCSG